MIGVATFMATELLRVTVDNQTTTDAPAGPGRLALDREHRRIFAAHTCQELLNNRAVVLPSDVYKIFDSIRVLKAYLPGIDDKCLADRLYSCWYFLKGFQPVTHDKCLPGAEFPGFMDTVKNHPSTPYTAVKATHEGLLRVFAAPEVESDADAGRG
ncbi:hypothetical protein TRAPUB_8099 [Trametes pubescens]|uniref:Uncharacterized protein n=1 Tax=Trametes pubescens TaxID=154538 RepID=A0A1M2W6A2_TRAPU|nr:hypothetical protein TRAPUB_8099 [Trametes pubescens]